MKKHKKIVHIYNDLYHLNIWYFKDWSRESFQYYLRTELGYDSFKDISNITGSVIPLNLKNKRTKRVSEIYCLHLLDHSDIGTVAHEAFHIVSRSLNEHNTTV